MGSYSSSRSDQRTDISTSNVQGNSAAVYGQDAVSAIATGTRAVGGSSNELAGTTEGANSHVLGRGASLNQSDNSINNITNANSTELAQIAANVSIEALKGYQQVNEQSLALAEKAANSVIDYKADTEGVGGLNPDDYVKVGALLAVVYFAYTRGK